MSQNFVLKESWRNIERSFIFDAAIYYPSDTKRPLMFFIPDEADSNKGILTRTMGDFSPRVVSGRRQAVEQKVVVTLKPRRVVVLSTNEMNQNEEFEFILVAPIMSITDFDKTKPWYKKMLTDEHPFFLHLPECVTGKECYVDLSELTSIHKSMLLHKHGCVTEERMIVLQDLLSECLDLGLAKEDEQTTETGTES